MRELLRRVFGVAIALLLVILVFLVTFSYYSDVSFGAEIEDYTLLNEQTALIKLSTGANSENITSVVFVFNDSSGRTYTYETTEGAQNISIPYSRFLFWKSLKGDYAYQINASSLGLLDFNEVVSVEVTFKYLSEDGSKEVEQTKVLDAKQIVDGGILYPSNKKKSSGGSSGGSGGSGGSQIPVTTPPTSPVCVPMTCSVNYSGFCGESLSDGCSGSLNCSNNCISGYICSAGSCIQSPAVSTCFEGIITSSCNCQGLVRNSGYCCSGVYSVSSCSVSGAGYTDRITKNGLTWYFDRAYQYGQFVNGDYWVIDDGSGINITHVDPMPYFGRNGNMVNPPIGQQAFHNSSGAYFSSLAVYFPKVLHMGESLVSTRSVNSSHNEGTKSAGSNTCGCVYDLSGYCVYNDDKPGCYQHAMVYQGAVLTVLGEVPPSDSFRPAYVSGGKEIYRLSSIDSQRGLLLSLDVANKPNITRQALLFENVWLDHVVDAPGRLMRPVKNGPTYGEHFSSNVGDSALMLNLNYSSTDKERLLINYLQLGLDLYGIVGAGGNWPNGGGHDQGRKIPIVFAGVMFNDTGMKSVQAVFSELTHSYAGKNASGQYVARYGWVVGSCTGTYTLSSTGCWGIVSSSGAKDCYNPAGLYDTCGYQGNIIYPWVGQSLALRYMYDTNSQEYVRGLYNHSPFFDFVDRWMNKDVAPSYSDSSTSLARSVWDKYRYCNSDADCVGHPVGNRCQTSYCPLQDCSGWNKKECTL